MGNIFCNCFAYKEHTLDRSSEDEEENKHHKQRRHRVSDDKTISLPDRLSEEEEDNKHHEQRARVSEEGISSPLDFCISEEDENKHHKKPNSSDLADRISDLPDDLLHLILPFLSFKSIGQTSVLSRRWNHVWSSYPIFDFYDIFTGHEAPHQQTRARIIHTLPVRHAESYNIMYPCLKIPLPSSSLGRFQRLGDVDDPKDSCSASFEELVVDISLSSENTYAFRTCQLKCQSSRSSSLENSKAWLGFPSSYVVWSFALSLRALSLVHLDLLDSSSHIFSGSLFPCLEKLDVSFCRGMSDLRICCPSLRTILVCGMKSKSIDITGMRLERLSVMFCFERSINGSWVNIFAPNLKSFTWVCNGTSDKSSIQSFPALLSCVLCWPLFTKTKISNNSVVDLFTSSSQVEDLCITSGLLEIIGNIYSELGGLPFSFMKLKTLHLSLGIYLGKTYIPAKGIAYLLRSSPIVNNLKVHFHMYSCERNVKWEDMDEGNCNAEQYWETQAQYLWPFLSHLEVVDMKADIVSDTAIDFAKFLLKYGRSLREMILRTKEDESTVPPCLLNDAIALMKVIPRASPDVKISSSFYRS